MKLLNLSLHKYAVLQHGEPMSFWSTLPLAALTVSDRNASGVKNLETGQVWPREECLSAEPRRNEGSSMSPANRLLVVPRDEAAPVRSTIDEYQPICSEIERRAYAAAHKLMQLSVSGERELACPGARRTAFLDRVAAVIAEEFGEIITDHPADSALTRKN